VEDYYSHVLPLQLMVFLGIHYYYRSDLPFIGTIQHTSIDCFEFKKRGTHFKGKKSTEQQRDGPRFGADVCRKHGEKRNHAPSYTTIASVGCMWYSIPVILVVGKVLPNLKRVGETLN
jgi:hypothetical protein